MLAKEERSMQKLCNGGGCNKISIHQFLTCFPFINIIYFMEILIL